MQPLSFLTANLTAVMYCTGAEHILTV